MQFTQVQTVQDLNIILGFILFILFNVWDLSIALFILFNVWDLSIAGGFCESDAFVCVETSHR